MFISQGNAWHFTNGYKLRDGSPLLSPGETHCFGDSTPVEICRSGFHASRTPWQALKYAPGSVLSSVYCEDIVTEHANDKLVCRKRTIIQTLDVEELLYAFARKQALSVIHLWDAPRVVRQYLETGDKKLRSAAESVAESAAESVAESAARSAARSAAWSAARSAAWSAARSAAGWAAWSAARSVAESAARSVAESAARSAAEKMFNDMVENVFFD